MFVLGLNAYHGDASACLFKDDKIILAVEEERLTRIKHAAGFPINAINLCLKKANISINDIDHITINRNPKQKFIPKIIYASTNIFNINFIKNRFLNIKKINSIKSELENFFQTKVNSKIHFIDHHTSHIASSVFFSKFNNTNFISVDGFGDFVSTVSGYFDGRRIEKYKEALFPHSLGIFYTSLTQYLGFNKYGDEYKVMGLAPYGKPIYLDVLRKIVKYDKKNLVKLNLKYFLHHTGTVDMTWLKGEPNIGKLYSNELNELLGQSRNIEEEITQNHIDIAASTQKIFEEILLKIAEDLYEQNNNKNLCISGGSGMNSVANGMLLKKTKYNNIYVPAAPGDAGGSIGSAAYFLNSINKNYQNFDDSAYLGENFTNNSIKDILDKYSNTLKRDFINVEFISDSKKLHKRVAQEIFDGRIVGFFNGKMEWGPRALGNRSILADPRNKNMKEVLNQKIKRRENFRPFAPSILKKFTKDWFEVDDNVPFMSKVFLIKYEKRNLIPAVTHVDGTGRLQTVSEEDNYNYYNLIKEFHKLSGVPILLNTSFNENEPIVNHPEEALKCFMRTKMDILVMENYLITRV